MKYTGTSILEFTKTFKTDEDCYRYLAVLKWGHEGYHCKKCLNTTYGSGKQPYSRRCSKCGYVESATSGTVFHKCKFSLLKAFHIVYRVCVKKKGMSSVELSKELNLRQKTCWSFKRKLQEAMKSSGHHPLEGDVEVDEFMIGGHESGKKGRSQGKKRVVVVGVEKRKTKKGKTSIGRAYAKVIEKAGLDEFTPFFDQHIEKNASIKTDQWRGYISLKKNYKLEQVPSDGGKNFPELHIHIMNIKSWLRGIHHKCTKEHLQAYLDEFHYRFNRRNFIDNIFHNFIEKLVRTGPMINLCKINDT